ncbi:MAG TPA: universal stress protein [Flavisolibacter sp.]
MNKILLAFDESSFSEGAFEFVRQLNEIQPVLLTAAFLRRASYADMWAYAAAAGSGAVFMPVTEDKPDDTLQQVIDRFEEACVKNGLQYRLHLDGREFSMEELKQETRFADLLVLGSEKLYQSLHEQDQYEYLRSILHSAECPVIVVPETFEFPTHNILAYDGSEASVFAIRQFAYILPQLAVNPTLLVYAEDDFDGRFPSESQLVELVTQHFPDLTLYQLELDPRQYFHTWINDRKSPVLVAGSYSRSAFAELFRKSFVADVIREHQVPVFIAHK